MASRNDKEGLRAYLRAYRKRPDYRAKLNAYLATPKGVKHIMVSTMRERAKKQGVPFNVCATDIEVPEICPILGIKLARNKGHGPRDNSPSVDRIIPDRGYVRGNINVISNRANIIKYNCTDPREIAAVAEYVALQVSLIDLCSMAQEF